MPNAVRLRGKMDELKFKIKFENGAFDEDAKHTQRSNFGNEVVPFSTEIQRLSPLIDELDRYDDFGMLKNDLANYKMTAATGEYGIKFDKTVHERVDVINEHQKRAAEDFLKVLRGFGLLADVVGSGKTFEAGVVLSELALRGVIKNMLIVVPEQVLANWIEVIEMRFGFGKGRLFVASDDLNSIFSNEEDFEILNLNGKRIFRPKKAIIVTYENFVKWKGTGKYSNDVLFDVIVVDEAHHLCEEQGSGAGALYLLSSMMALKKSFGTTYCLLLSATPHSGNLANMFRLWYFIRCKGGNPDDFLKDSDEHRSQEYLKEQEYYKNFICHRATTVMEFIKKVKIDTVTKSDKYKSDFSRFLSEENISPNNSEAFNLLSDAEKWPAVDSFIEADFIRRNEISKIVANAYHNGVLRSIMIRQANSRTISKKIINYYLAPSDNPPHSVTVKGLNDETINATFKNGNVLLEFDGKTMSLKEYAAKYKQTNKKNAYAYAQMLFDNRIFKAMGVNEDNFTVSGVKRVGALSYYWEQFASSPEEAEDKFVFYDKSRNVNEYKLFLLIQLLKKHEKERVIVFYDYDGKSALKERVYNSIKDTFKDRLLVGTQMNKDEVIKAFNKKDDAIMLVHDECYTEGANLQSGNIIINFEVTHDPVEMSQRIGRVYRIGQSNDVTVYSFADMRALEGYVTAYFTRIGLMTTDSGDATIIAGSNSEKMVAVRCPVPGCGNVKLFSEDEYEIYKRKDSDELYCTATGACTQDYYLKKTRGTRMEQISVKDFRCPTCESAFIRTARGYECISNSKNGKGVMGNNAHDRNLFCTKRCAVTHCQRLEDIGCPLLKAIKDEPQIHDIDLIDICSNCNLDCMDKCRYIPYDEPAKAIEGCSTCPYAMCTPKPHVLSFDENWEAVCPVCGDKIKEIHSKTFATYISELWEFRHDEKAFCESLRKEAKNVAAIQKILENDTEVK